MFIVCVLLFANSGSMSACEEDYKYYEEVEFDGDDEYEEQWNSHDKSDEYIEQEQVQE